MNVLIADDHPLVRDALARTLRGVLPDAQVIEADDLPAAVAALRANACGLVLLDLHMPGMDGVAGVRQLRALFPSVPLAVVSAEQDPATVRAACAAGAVAWLPKSEAPAVLQQALRLVLGGGSYLPALALADLRPGAPAPQPDLSRLTPRQRDVLRCLMQGLPNKLIARELGLSEGTVKIHLAALLRTLQARNRTEAVVMARRIGVSPTTP
jgi:DNA-binding NarL/FixJ family response regulator